MLLKPSKYSSSKTFLSFCFVSDKDFMFHRGVGKITVKKWSSHRESSETALIWMKELFPLWSSRGVVFHATSFSQIMFFWDSLKAVYLRITRLSSRNSRERQKESSFPPSTLLCSVPMLPLLWTLLSGVPSPFDINYKLWVFTLSFILFQLLLVLRLGVSQCSLFIIMLVWKRIQPNCSFKGFKKITRRMIIIATCSMAFSRV